MFNDEESKVLTNIEQLAVEIGLLLEDKEAEPYVALSAMSLLQSAIQENLANWIGTNSEIVKAKAKAEIKVVTEETE
jgi:hypothetical protein